MKKYIEPVRIVDSENCVEPENILKGLPCQAGFCKNDSMVIKSGGYILLDFGKEIHGCIAVTALETSARPVKSRIVYGESVMEALSNIGEKNSTNAHAIRDMVVDIMPWSTTKYGETGFRFAKVEALDGDIRIKSINAIPEIRDIPYIGSFECSDERLNEIWRVGAYTVQLNMHDYIWDGIKRDRLVWVGDMHPEVSVIRTVFGNDESVRKSLDFIRDETGEDEWMNGMPTYSMWWIIIHYEWFMHWGDAEYLKEQLDYMKVVVNKAVAWIDSGYNCDDFKVFVDWSSRFSEGEMDGIKAVFCMGLDCAAKVFDAMQENEYSEKCRAYVKRMQSEEITINGNKRMSALTVLSGRDSHLAQSVISDNSAEGMSCFMGYYIIKAKAMLGQTKDAVDVIRKYWGGMLDMGATTFWEDFDIRWMENSARIDERTPEGMQDIHGDFGRYCYEGYRQSLCHGWASGPTPFLMEQVGGIEILEPGCKKIRINPAPAGLKWFKIKYPTPYGILSVSYDISSGEEILDINGPYEVEIVR